MSSGQGGCWAASEESRLTASETRSVALAFTWSSRLPGNQLPPAVHRDGHRARGLDHDGGSPVADRPGRRYRDTAQREIVPPVATGVIGFRIERQDAPELQAPGRGDRLGLLTGPHGRLPQRLNLRRRHVSGGGTHLRGGRDTPPPLPRQHRAPPAPIQGPPPPP